MRGIQIWAWGKASLAILTALRSCGIATLSGLWALLFMPRERINFSTSVETGVLARSASACLKEAPGKLSICRCGCENGGSRQAFESPRISHFLVAVRDQAVIFLFVGVCRKGLNSDTGGGGGGATKGVKESLLCIGRLG